MKINYDNLLREFLENLTERKTLLLHSCCGPCSSYVIDFLSKYFDITILYYNPNIYPESEYLKRLETQKKLIVELNNPHVKIIDIGYQQEKYYKVVKGHEGDIEGGERCHICYKLRLEMTAKYARDNNFDYFTTTLSVSPYKHSDVLNNIGLSLEEKYGVKYLCADFKKKDGYKKSIELSKKYDLYRQDYCGCVYSKDALEKVLN